MREKVEVNQFREVRTFTILRAVSWYTYKLAAEDEHGRFLHLISSMVFTAFCLEGFLNHVGQEKIEFWETLKRKLNPSEKLKIICELLKIQPDYSKRPFQTFKEIFKLRDQFAHSETYKFIEEHIYMLEMGENPPEPLAPWEKQISINKTKRFLDDSKAIITEISKAANYDIATILFAEEPRMVIRKHGIKSIVSS